MHQSLSGLPERVLLDTNVLLNACFVQDCSARGAIAELAKLGFEPVIDQSIKHEAEKVLRRLYIKCCLGFDPATLLSLYLASENIQVLPAAPFINCSRVNRADRHVYSAGIFYSAWVLTGDVQCMAQCASQGVASRLPIDVLMEASFRGEMQLPLKYLLRYAGIRSDQGSVFARVIPGNWAGMKGIGKFAVCEIENVLTLAYDSERSGWSLSIRGGGEGFAELPMTKGEQHFVVSGGFKAPIYDSKGSAFLRVSSSTGEEKAIGFELKGGPTASQPGLVTFGHRVNGRDHWNGHIRSIVVSPNQISADTWKALKANPDSTPDPASGNIVEAALRKIRSVAGSAIFPTEAEIGRVWI